MTLRARFGLLGHDRQTYLPGTDPAALPGPDGLGTPPHPDALDPGVFTPGADGTEALFDGRATAATAGFGTASARTVFDVVGAWNSVKNLAVASDEAADLAFLGFVHVDAAVGLGSTEGSALEVVGAKRGNLVTGAGADRIDIQFASNLSIWSGEFRVASGAGGDEVRIAPLDVRLEQRAGDATFATAPWGAGPDPDYSGWATEVWVDLGDGDDRLSVGGIATVTVDGGAGDDRIALYWDGTARGGDGRDTLLGGAQSDDLRGDGGADTVSGGGGWDSLYGGEGSDRVTGEAQADSLQGDSGADTLSGGEDDDTLSGGEGDDALAGDGGWDVAAYAGRSADFEVAIGSVGGVRVVTVRDRNAADSDEGTDTLTGVEHLRFADQTVSVPTLAAGVPGVVFLKRGDWGRGATFWVSDGTAEGTVPFKEIAAPGYAEAGYPYHWVALGDGRALATVGSGWEGVDLWITDGNDGGTRLVKAIPPGAADTVLGHPYGPVALGDGKALFAIGNGADAVEFWITDGTDAGTSALATVASDGRTGYYPQGLVALGDGRALFAAGDDRGTIELWTTDGTAAGTAPVTTVTTGTPQGEGHGPGDFFALGDGRALFAAGDSATGRELWVTDGTADGTMPVKDINPGDGSSYLQTLASLGDGRVLLSANDPTAGRELWVTDGTADGTMLVKDINPNGSGAPWQVFALGDGRGLMATSDGVSGHELWVTDGTADGTALLKDINAGPVSGDPHGFTALGGGRVLFSANDGASGYELWVTDGTADGTALLKDINAGPVGSGPHGFAALADGRVLFSANDGISGSELWITDGTADGTALLKDIEPGYGSGFAYHTSMPVVGGTSWLDSLG